MDKSKKMGMKDEKTLNKDKGLSKKAKEKKEDKFEDKKKKK